MNHCRSWLVSNSKQAIPSEMEKSRSNPLQSKNTKSTRNMKTILHYNDHKDVANHLIIRVGFNSEYEMSPSFELLKTFIRTYNYVVKVQQEMNPEMVGFHGNPMKLAEMVLTKKTYFEDTGAVEYKTIPLKEPISWHIGDQSTIFVRHVTDPICLKASRFKYSKNDKKVSPFELEAFVEVLTARPMIHTSTNDEETLEYDVRDDIAPVNSISMELDEENDREGKKSSTIDRVASDLTFEEERRHLEVQLNDNRLDTVPCNGEDAIDTAELDKNVDTTDKEETLLNEHEDKDVVDVELQLNAMETESKDVQPQSNDVETQSHDDVGAPSNGVETKSHDVGTQSHDVETQSTDKLAPHVPSTGSVTIDPTEMKKIVDATIDKLESSQDDELESLLQELDQEDEVYVKHFSPSEGNNTEPPPAEETETTIEKKAVTKPEVMKATETSAITDLDERHEMIRIYAILESLGVKSEDFHQYLRQMKEEIAHASTEEEKNVIVRKRITEMLHVSDVSRQEELAVVEEDSHVVVESSRSIVQQDSFMATISSVEVSMPAKVNVTSAASSNSPISVVHNTTDKPTTSGSSSKLATMVKVFKKKKDETVVASLIAKEQVDVPSTINHPSVMDFSSVNASTSSSRPIIKHGTFSGKSILKRAQKLLFRQRATHYMVGTTSTTGEEDMILISPHLNCDDHIVNKTIATSIVDEKKDTEKQNNHPTTTTTTTSDTENTTSQGTAYQFVDVVDGNGNVIKEGDAGDADDDIISVIMDNKERSSSNHTTSIELVVDSNTSEVMAPLVIEETENITEGANKLYSTHHDGVGVVHTTSEASTTENIADKGFTTTSSEPIPFIQEQSTHHDAIFAPTTTATTTTTDLKKETTIDESKVVGFEEVYVNGETAEDDIDALVNKDLADTTSTLFNETTHLLNHVMKQSSELADTTSTFFNETTHLLNHVMKQSSETVMIWWNNRNIKSDNNKSNNSNDNRSHSNNTRSSNKNNKSRNEVTLMESSPDDSNDRDENATSNNNEREDSNNDNDNTSSVHLNTYETSTITNNHNNKNNSYGNNNNYNDNVVYDVNRKQEDAELLEHIFAKNKMSRKRHGRRIKLWFRGSPTIAMTPQME